MSSAPAPARRVGVFGGAFDPPHVGHVALAKVALDQLQLDVLHVVPTGQAWHKTRTLTGADHRLAMTRLAFGGLSAVVVDSRETRRDGPSYTVDTLGELAQEYLAAQMFLILGQDQAAALQSWHRWEGILQSAIICVAARADSMRATDGFYTHLMTLPGVRTLNLPPVDVSATDIRRRLAHHENVAALVFEPVARYIDHHHLYQTA